jgi:hypothetical protein
MKRTSAHIIFTTMKSRAGVVMPSVNMRMR